MELAKSETRVYLKAENSGSSRIGFSSLDAKLVQGETQYDTVSPSDTNLKPLPSEILPGVKAKGVVVFPRIDRSIKQVKIYFDKPSSENLEEEFSPIIFDVSLPK